MKKKVWKQAIVFLLLSIMIELAVFNSDSFVSYFQNMPVSLKYRMCEKFSQNEKGDYVLQTGETGCIFLDGIQGELGYLYFDIDCKNIYGETLPYTLQIAISDAGHSELGFLPAVKVYSDEEGLKYINAHSYGEVNDMQVYISTTEEGYFEVGDMVYHARVPFRIIPSRILLVLISLLILWCVRPSSDLYTKQWSKREKAMLIGAVIGINLLIWQWMMSLNPDFITPGWEHHKQYHRLAVALADGEVSINLGIEEAISKLKNPYDMAERNQMVPNATDGWDTAFYQGKFYVYFGILPVLLFYLPFYLITGTAFPTHWGVFTAGAAVLIGVFYLLDKLIKRYFPGIPFLLYVVLAVIAGNCISTMMFMLRPDFYSLPILCAIAFSVWGLALWISAEGKLWRLCLGSLFMALVAACRPQFLVGAFLAFFIFAKEIKEDSKYNRRALVMKLTAALIPFAVTATALMYYNFIRFGSPFDFGANYNLTNNDMTERGFHIGRMTDGIFAYLLQFPNVNLLFPHVFPVGLQVSYVGKVICESMFGGALFTNIIFFVFFAMGTVKSKLKEKGLYGFAAASILFAIIVAAADAQLAGLLSRYYADFVWLLMIAACIVFFQVWEAARKPEIKKALIGFIIICGAWGLFMQFGMGIQAGQIESGNPEAFYAIKTFLN